MKPEHRKKILYFGNKLHIHGKTKTMMEKLEPKLAEWNEVTAVSNKKNKVLRAIEFFFTFITKAPKADWIIIDVYSTVNFWFAVALSLLSIVFNKPYILFLHGGNLPKRDKTSPKIVSFILRKATHVIAPSSYLADYFTQKKFAVEIVPNFIDIQNYPFQMKTCEQPKILYLRGFGEAYNPLMLIKAIEILKTKFPKIQTTMIGKKDEIHYAQCIEYINNHNLKKHIDIVSPLSFKQWTGIANNCNFMVSTTHTDNLPVSVIEGMALGLLVIATNVGGISKLISSGENGILVEPNNSEDLAQTIIKMQSDTYSYNKIVTHARYTALKYDWLQTKPIWIQLLNISKQL